MSHVVGHILCRRVPLRGSLRQGFQADEFQFLEEAIIHLARWSAFDVGDLLQQFLQRVLLERSLSGKQLVEDDAQTEDATAAIDPSPRA